jgi:AraC family transcriptional regulator
MLCVRNCSYVFLSFNLAWALKDELEISDRFDRVYADGLGVALAVHVLRSYSQPASASHRGFTNWQLKGVLRFIDENLDKNLSLAELARQTCVSVSYFKVLFKESMGMPVHKYVVKRRVEYASMLVTSGTASLSEIAVQAGFCDQGHMARCMRRLTGMAPSELARISR